MNDCVMKSIVDFLGDIPIPKLTFKIVREWTKDLDKTRASNTIRGYILKIRVVLRHLKASGYDVLDPEVIGIPKRDPHRVNYMEIDEVKQLLHISFRKDIGYSKFKRYRNRNNWNLIGREAFQESFHSHHLFVQELF